MRNRGKVVVCLSQSYDWEGRRKGRDAEMVVMRYLFCWLIHLLEC